jgi:predicted nucleic-acid-binding Zn-ribbon protein
MTRGFATAVRGGGPNTYTQPEIWVEGPPAPSLWTGSQVKDKVHYTLVADRCDRCGYVEFYAPADE